ncbi:MAG TPA: bifunctional phosphoribosylaminoimidazolecarboxamide formyltransferase/IMP cyclohydrolase, partial [Ignavibacteria bacterium]
MKRALISVYNKEGIVDFTKELIKNGFEIVSTSGTARLLTQNGVKLKTIEEITKAPEVLGGRVKTLQHLVFAGILADKNNPSHQAEVKKFGFKLFDLVVVSLYPFVKTVGRENCTTEEAIEQIDIGGVSLIRAAAKNYSNVCVLVDPSQYKPYLAALKSGENVNLKFASDAFVYVGCYDIRIAEYFGKISGRKNGILDLFYSDYHELRYGENPHQSAKLYEVGSQSFSDIFEKLHGKELSYINILDIDSAYNLIREFDEPSCVIIKHTNPSGAASGNNINEAYKRAFQCDTVSPFGGIVIVNKELDLQTAEEIDKIFTEIVIAPSFAKDAYDFLIKKKNRRLIKYNIQDTSTEYELKSVTGGLLMQQRDN